MALNRQIFKQRALIVAKILAIKMQSLDVGQK